MAYILGLHILRSFFSNISLTNIVTTSGNTQQGGKREVGSQVVGNPMLGNGFLCFFLKRIKSTLYIMVNYYEIFFKLISISEHLITIYSSPIPCYFWPHFMGAIRQELRGCIVDHPDTIFPKPSLCKLKALVWQVEKYLGKRAGKLSECSGVDEYLRYGLAILPFFFFDSSHELLLIRIY